MADNRTDIAGEPSMKLGERDGMITAMPFNGLIASLRPPALAGVMPIWGRFCIELLGVRTAAALVS